MLDREDNTDCLIIKAGLAYKSLDELPEVRLFACGIGAGFDTETR